MYKRNKEGVLIAHGVMAKEVAPFQVVVTPDYFGKIN